MKKLVSIMMLGVLVFSMCGCNTKEEKRVVTKEPGGTITIVSGSEKETQEPVISVEKIEQMDGHVIISDWLDEENVIVSKENTELGKMTIEEFEGYYPRSLYSYNVTTKEYTPIKEEENVILGGGTLSADKKYLLYSEYFFGDPSYYILNLDTKESFLIMDEVLIDGARSAGWSENEVIGSAYVGGIYSVSTSGEIKLLEGFEKEEPIYIIRATKDYIFYTGEDATLMKMNRATKEKTSLNISNVFDVVLSADKTKMLVLQSDNTKSTLLLYEMESGKQTTIAEGTEINSVSWSSDQRMIAYTIKSDETNATVNGLYVYDMLSTKATQIAVDIENAFTSWSPMGDKLMFSQWKGEEYESSIVFLNSTITNN